MTIYIKNMVCVRCKMAVQTVLEELSMDYTSIELGRVELKRQPTAEEMAQLDKSLRRFELEVMEDKKKILVERIKTQIIDLLHMDGSKEKQKLSTILSKGLYYDYTYLANVFSEIEGSTIERFYIEQRIERIKELIVYEGINISEISFLLNFRSVSHLCVQFKKVTGMSPASFRKQIGSPDFIWRK